MTDPDTAEGPRIACCQAAVVDLDVSRNLEHVGERLRALPADVDVALFPELALTGFADDDRMRERALARDGPELAHVSELAAETATAVLVGFAERAAGELFNAAAYVPTDGDPAIYRKRHLWGAERARFVPGDRRVVVETPVGRTGLLTCYDLNFVTESAWFTAERVDALLVIGAWPVEHAANWRLLCRARALDGARWLAACGRTGSRTIGTPTADDRSAGTPTADDRTAVAEPDVTYAGASLLVRPTGEVTAELGRGERDLIGVLDAARFLADREEVGIFDGDGPRSAGSDRG